MKRLRVTAVDGSVLAELLVNVEGDNVNFAMSLPMFLPVVNLSLLDLEKKETKRIRETIKRIKSIVE